MENQPDGSGTQSQLETTPLPPSKPLITQPRKPKSLNLILSLITLTSLSASAYFFYQNQLLEQELASLPLNEGEEVVTSLTPTTTNDWRTYTNNQYAFAFQYPQTLYLQESAADTPLVIYLATNSIEIPTGSGGPLASIEIRVKDIELNQAINTVSDNFTINQQDTIGQNGILLQTLGKEGTPFANAPWTFAYLPGSKYLIEAILSDTSVTTEDFTKILSTFEFTSTTQPSSTAIQVSNPATALSYSLPSGWQTVTDPTNTFQIGHDPQSLEQIQDSDSLMFKFTTGTKSLQSVFQTTSYNGGSRHLYLQEQMGEPLNEGDKMPDFQEVEYLIQGKKCLVYDGYAISMSPQVWGMCPVSSQKALFFNLARNDYLTYLKTIKFL